MAYGKIKADTLVFDNSGSDVEIAISTIATGSLSNYAPLAGATFTGGITGTTAGFSGRMLVGTSTAPSVGIPSSATFVVQGYVGSTTGDSLISLQRGQAPASIASGAQLGAITFGANDGSPYAQIHAATDSSGGSGDYPGRLVFSTTADSGSAPTERMRIDSSGNVGIGTTSPRRNFHVHNPATATTGLMITNANTGEADDSQGFQLKVGADSHVEISQMENSHIGIFTNASERMRIDSSGNVGIGTSSPAFKVDITGPGTANASTLRINDAASSADSKHIRLTRSNTNAYIGIAGTVVGDPLFISRTGANSDFTITSAARVGIGTAYPLAKLHINGATEGIRFGLSGASAKGDVKYTNSGLEFLDLSIQGTTTGYGNIRFSTGGGPDERMRINSSGNVGIGTSSPDVALMVHADSGVKIHAKSQNTTAVLELAGTRSLNAAPVAISKIKSIPENPTGNSDNTSLAFEVRSQANGIIEAMRILSDGVVLVGKTSDNYAAQGVRLHPISDSHFTRDNGNVVAIRRNGSDGTMLDFWKNGSSQGTISVSGSTISYNGAHLARWSQLPGGEERTEILRGSVLSNLDEMCEWGEEDNEQLNRMQVSTVVGDKNVSGVFQSWDDDDDEYINDFYCAMTGDFVIRIAQGTTVARGDLLMSAGDGTAKPQDDDIIRSKTIAKVTSTNVSETYEDGSYCVPCVLMAC